MQLLPGTLRTIRYPPTHSYPLSPFSKRVSNWGTFGAKRARSIKKNYNPDCKFIYENQSPILPRRLPCLYLCRARRRPRAGSQPIRNRDRESWRTETSPRRGRSSRSPLRACPRPQRRNLSHQSRRRFVRAERLIPLWPFTLCKGSAAVSRSLFAKSRYRPDGRSRPTAQIEDPSHCPP